MKPFTPYLDRGQSHWLILLLALAAVLLGCQPASTSPAAGPAAGAQTTFAGAVAGTDTFVAVVSDGQRAMAYVCDSQAVAEWFNGEVRDGALDLASAAGARLQASLGSDGANGTFTPAGGDALAFTADPVSAPAGLYRAEENIGGQQYVGGWIVLADGRQQGAVKATGEVSIQASRRISIPFGTGELNTVIVDTDVGQFNAVLIESVQN